MVIRQSLNDGRVLPGQVVLHTRTGFCDQILGAQLPDTYTVVVMNRDQARAIGGELHVVKPVEPLKTNQDTRLLPIPDPQVVVGHDTDETTVGAEAEVASSLSMRR